MKNEEKIKINIEKLKSQSDFHKWQFGQYNTYLIGIIAILIALFVPTTLVISGVTNKIILAVLLIILCFISYLVIHSLSKKSENQIRGLSRKIEENYNELEKL
ncbi:hypothetical protein FJZ21_04120 [Candidatus Pacearchaeota archaeon]|nr:hypothetical protein [Candidatus Pacearchaeota archaeon]